MTSADISAIACLVMLIGHMVWVTREIISATECIRVPVKKED